MRTWMVTFAVAACDESLVTKRETAPSPGAPTPSRVEPAEAPAQPREPRETHRPAPPPPAESAKPEPAKPADAPTKPDDAPAIRAFVADAPMSLAVVGDTLFWTDPAGSLWSMPSRGGTPTELSHQQMPGSPMFTNLVAHGNALIAARRGDLVRVAGPRGPLEPLGLSLGSDALLDLESDGTAVYATSFEHQSAIYKIEGDKKTKRLDHKRASIAIAGDTLYAVSYSTGVLVAVMTTGGRPRVIARGLAKATGFDVDGKAAYVWGEVNTAIRRIDLATGKITVLAKEGFDNTDVIVEDGDWIYTHAWLGEGKSTSCASQRTAPARKSSRTISARRTTSPSTPTPSTSPRQQHDRALRKARDPSDQRRFICALKPSAATRVQLADAAIR